MTNNLPDTIIDRLVSFENLAHIPRTELQWLVEHGRYQVIEPGAIIAPKGKPVDYLFIILSGKVAIRVDRGAGPKLVAVWKAGDVTGMLPYSRMKAPPGNNIVEETSEAIVIDVAIFPEMINHCPVFTAYTVHSMIDRARKFNTSDLQDEKMISLGKLSAGLAHELNNPASATVRNIKMLIKGVANLDTASRNLGAAGLAKTQLDALENLCLQCLESVDMQTMSPIEKGEYQDQIADWIKHHKLNPALEIPLADTNITLKQLEELTTMIPGHALELTINWLTARFLADSLTLEIENATTRIHDVINAVKKFSYMDNLGEKGLVDIASGVMDTLSVLIAKTKAKNAEIILNIPPDVPKVYASGEDINQVWFCLLDNALDAIPDTGMITVSARRETDRVEVSIIDNGPGIPTDKLSKIFDPFYTTKAPGQGTGLGLDIARRLLRRYHGDIFVQSKPGRTEFCVNLLINEPGHSAKN